MKRSEKLLRRAGRLLLIGLSMKLGAATAGPFAYVLWLEMYLFPGVMVGALAMWLLCWGVVHTLDAWDVFTAWRAEKEWERYTSTSVHTASAEQ